MAKKKTSGLGGLFLIIIAGMAWVFAQYGRGILIVVGIAFAAWVVYKMFASKTQSPSVPTSPGGFVAPQVLDAISFRAPSSLPTQPISKNGDDYWQKATSVGNSLGGWIYYGKGLKAVGGGGVEPALIDPGLPVDRSVQDCHIRRLGYWPTYDSASPEARGAFLQWLTSGRQDPSADIGYVFLYFYGLERRVLHDAQFSSDAKSEIPEIQGEIERLLSIYKSSGSFQSYAGSLLDILKYKSIEPQMYNREPPPLRGERELTLEHRIALGQCSADGKPLPAEWAFVWFISAPTTYLRTPAKRCPDAFQRLFILRYREVFGDGMALPRNQTLLKLDHRPASPTFGHGSSGQSVKLDLSDVTVLSSPVKKLQELAETCSSQLDSYSRFIGKNEELVGSFDAMVELPLVLWPAEVRKPIEETKDMVDHTGKPLALPFEKMLGWLPKWQLINKQKLKSLYRALGEVGLGMEPDVRFNGGIPAAASTVVLFADDKGPSTSVPTPSYAAAALTLQLATAVAGADGHSSDVEIGTLTRQLEEWLHLGESERRRLHARLLLMLSDPPKIAGLKSRIETMDAQQREAIGGFLALVALADSQVTPAEIKVLEKTFRLLGLDPKSVYSMVHVAVTEPVTIRPADLTPGGHAIPLRPKSKPGFAFKLDPAKVAALQADSERVAALLRTIFDQPVPEQEAPAVDPEPDEAQPQELLLPGLDKDHSSLVRTLLGRAHWSRAELEELAADRGFMLDGVLEQINDATFSQHNKPLFEGEDPIEINQEVARELLH